MGDVLITLTHPDGSEETIRTNSDGEFEFNNLDKGTYLVEESDPFALMSTTPNQVTTFLADSSNVFFGDAQSGSINGQVEALITVRWWWWSYTLQVPLGNVPVELWDITRTTRLQSTTTAGNGVYQFSNGNTACVILIFRI